MIGHVILSRGAPASHQIARADRFWRHAVGCYGLALLAVTSIIQLHGIG